MKPKKIVMVAAEVAPLIKIGGLADVVGALPKALRARGHEVAIILPGYDAIDQHRYPSTRRWSNLLVRWQGRDLVVAIDQTVLPDTNIPVWLVRCPEIFETKNVLHGLAGVYANSDNPDLLRQEIGRFVFFSWAVASLLPQLDWRPDIIHCHDWHAASVPLWQALISLSQVPTVLTIHNLQNQGRWSANEVFQWLGLSGHEHPALANRDTNGNLNLLQLGIELASAVNTVSPTYAQEILTPEYGEGLEQTLRHRRPAVVGIVNGIDTAVFNPATDAALVERYEQRTATAHKKKNKLALQDELGLTKNPGAFLLGFVGRLVEQKGLHLLPPIIAAVLGDATQVVLLGSGLPRLEKELAALAERYSGTIVLRRGFDAALAQRIYAGSDAFLMPSKFEPCGLGQLIAMRYGTLPIVHSTGGLRDTVLDLTIDPNRGTGFVFTDFTPAAFLQAIERAKTAFRQPGWSIVIERAMRQDFSWHQSAQDYENLYAQI